MQRRSASLSRQQVILLQPTRHRVKSRLALPPKKTSASASSSPSIPLSRPGIIHFPRTSPWKGSLHLTQTVQPLALLPLLSQQTSNSFQIVPTQRRQGDSFPCRLLF